MFEVIIPLSTLLYILFSQIALCAERQSTGSKREKQGKICRRRPNYKSGLKMHSIVPLNMINFITTQRYITK
jgi:hypothetical protein